MQVLRSRFLIIALVSISVQAYLTVCLPHEHIKVPGYNCSWEYRQHGVKVNLTDLTGGQEKVLIPVDGQNKSIIVGFCRGMNITCQGKENKGTAACLINNITTTDQDIINKLKLTAENSTVIGAISKSHISVLNNRLIYESTSYTQTCNPNNDDKTKKQSFKLRLEFYCSRENLNNSHPRFSKYQNCTYQLEWPTIHMCELEEKLPKDPASQDNSTPNENATTTTIPKNTPEAKTGVRTLTMSFILELASVAAVIVCLAGIAVHALSAAQPLIERYRRL